MYRQTSNKDVQHDPTVCILNKKAAIVPHTTQWGTIYSNVSIIGTVKFMFMFNIVKFCLFQVPFVQSVTILDPVFEEQL